MTKNQALVYWVRYSMAEVIFRVAAWVKPANYEFDAVRRAIHMMIENFADGRSPQVRDGERQDG